MACKDCVVDFDSPPPKGLKDHRTAGLVFASLIGGGAVLLSAICVPFITPALRRVCLPYVPATNTQLANVKECLKTSSGSLVDIGSGDGRIVVEAAKMGFQATGIELNPWLVWYSRIASLKLSLPMKPKFLRQDLWKTSLSSYSNVVIFGVDTMMQDFEKKCWRELHKGSYVVACRFPLPNSSPCKVVGEGIDTVWMYEIGSQNIEMSIKDSH